MTATFLLVRHAVTGDVDVRLSGRRAGVPLTAAGIAQAEALARALAAAPPDLLLTSPLERTRMTAEAIGAATGREAVADDALLEIDLGEWTGAEFATLRDDPRWTTWNRERATACCPGGETMAQAQARIVGLMERLAAEDAGRTVALVTHADLIKGAVCHLLGLGLEAVHRFDIDPASVTRLVVGEWGGRVLAVNGTFGED